MKRFLSIFLSIILAITAFAPLSINALEPAPILEYNFENVSGTTITAAGHNATLKGNAKIVNDSAKKSNVLYLDGGSSYLEFEKGLFDNRDEMTISMDVKSMLNDGNFFTFAYGQDNTKYAFLRVRGYETCFIVSREGNRDENYAGALKARTGKWHIVTVVINNGATTLYINGVKVANGIRDDAGITTSQLGENLSAYLGKSFYEGDQNFKGYFDNFKLYDRALSEDEVLNSVASRAPFVSRAIVGTTVDPSTKGTDNHTASGAIIDNEAKTITPYVKKSADLTALPVKIECISKDCTLKIDGKAFTNGSKLNLKSDRKLTVSYNGISQTYTIKAATVSYNAALPGQYADPDIDYINGKYWIFPTTDGYDWWSGTQFHAFSSTDLQSWNDEGVVLDVADKNPGLNAKGVQIASCPWSNVNAWAPTVEAKNGKCYLYFCGNYVKTNRMAIGVAVADNPAGPYTVNKEPLISDDVPVDGYTPLFTNGTQEIDGVFQGQTIDPSIFTDDDGTSYILFGNGTPALFKLNKNMTSVDINSYKRINKGHGLPNFCESVYCVKRKGIYHFTWSCNGTDDERYMVGYGTATSLTGDVTYRYTLMKENEDIGALCTAHQSLVYRKDIDKCYIAYHRFYTPLGIYTDQYGKHRETCVDEITFDSNGLMKQKKPSMLGITKPASSLSVTLSSTSYTYDGKAKKPCVTVKEKNGNVIPARDYTVTYSSNTNPGKASVVVNVNAKYVGKITKTFTIKPKATSISSLSAISKGFTVKWSKRTTQVTGYQIQYSTSSSFSSPKTITITKNSTVSKKVTKLKAKKRYYVRVRTYKTSNSVKYYSAWSAKKYVTTKK